MPLSIKQSADYTGHDHWKWSVWLDGTKSELMKVRQVHYLLHPSFSPPTRVVANRRTKFRLDESGWGEFTIRADVQLANGAVQRLEHELKLEQPEVDARASKSKATEKTSAAQRKPATTAVEPPLKKNRWLAHWHWDATASMLEAEGGPRAHITFIHGIANKPTAEMLLKLWLEALADAGGINLTQQRVTASMVYWADVLYADPWTEVPAAEGGAESPEEATVELLATWEGELPLQEQVFVASLRSKLQIAEAKSLPELSLEEGFAAGAEERIPLPWFLKRPLMERLLRDVHHYLFNVEFSPRPGETYRVRDEIRRRFVTALSGVTTRPHIIVAHSLGTVIAYDCLKRVAECPPIDTLLTIGSPLGLDEIQDMLRPEWTRRDGFPAKLTNWTNVFDRLDPVCGFDPQLANDFQRGGQKVIEDIHEPNSGWFRHPIEKYLRGPLLHSALQRAIARGTSARGLSDAAETDLPAPALHIARRPEPPLRASPPPAQGNAMPSTEKFARLTQFFRQIAPPDRLESLRAEMPRAMESASESLTAPAAPPGPEPTPEAAERAVEKLQAEQPLDEVEMLSLEAIVLPRERPVVFIENDTFPMPESPWEHFVQPAIRTNLERAIPAIGRVELPSNPSIPFGGTAFVVGPNLLMTNRHVAELFASGLGQSVMFRTGHDAGWDYRRERSSPATGDTMLEVKRIVMIHPYWDMALLEVAGLLPMQTPLRLAVAPPEELAGREVAIVGYPAKDWRNDSELQDRIFGRTYNVKRLQPGKIVSRESIRSFQNNVLAVTHDSSTLGGNSGSAVVDVQTGEIVGLHFAGLYLKANYAVPTYELARDPRVVNAGVNFSGAVPADPGLDRIWRAIDPREARTTSLTTVTQTQPPVVKRVSPATTTAAIRVEVGNVSFSVPVQVSVSTPPSGSRESPFAQPLADDLLEGLKQPKIFPRLDRRDGYNPQFLELDGGLEVPLPKLTAAGKEIVARLDGGSPELKYHKFSIVLHKLRRMALFTAANVDWREQQRKVNGKKPTRKQLNGFATDASELWATDERIPANQQLPDKFYTLDGGFFQKGHVVRRDDVCWGSSFADMQKANGDTFHTTNCTPQLAGFNMANEGEDNWGDLENLIQAETGAERVIVFAGPVLNDEEDLRFEGVDERGEVHIQIPSQFWKIVVAKGANGPEAFGFVLEQDLADVPLEFALPARWRRYLRKISDIEKLLFGNATLDALEPFDQFNSLRGRRLTNRVRR